METKTTVTAARGTAALHTGLTRAGGRGDLRGRLRCQQSKKECCAQTKFFLNLTAFNRAFEGRRERMSNGRRTRQRDYGV
ncbi:hypothetical protein EVAR_65636_1 [Eumeta japonica]|uniref:Uncharacterized protein n=1 Tax=Eumeta variegata TaxID=151549 RepID=A0A4C1Z6P1_EUMVA|nr:hypothetical protein EVAR_65636_1 [Eumeta japonica]